MNESDRAWLAGLLEGEGCFSVNRGQPFIKLSMTDKDVVVHAAEIMSKTVSPGVRKLPSGKSCWTVNVNGNQALAIMDALYPLMGDRRRARISEVQLEVQAWRAGQMLPCGRCGKEFHRKRQIGGPSKYCDDCRYPNGKVRP